MKTSRFGVLAAPLLLVPLAMRAPEASPPPSTPAHTYDVHCEVWSATDGELMASLEAFDANGAEAALQVLQSAENGAERLLRVLAPIDQGKSAQFESLSEEPTVQVTASGRGGTQQNFAGYTSSGTSATLTCNPGSSEGTISTSLGLQVSNFSEEGDADRAPSIPPSRRTFEVRCDATGAPGQLRMLQFQTRHPGTLVVFVRASAL